ncbi:MAG: c-type cytochrome [Elusimicrobia bacterium]|nr:c-type cytochrome [Elusimicrobiota bacterium]
MKKPLIVIAVIAAAAALGGIAVLKGGYMEFGADRAPSALETNLAMAALDASLDRHSEGLKNPLQADEKTLKAGAEVYLNHCAGCHGLPYNPNSEFGRSFNPPVPQFFTEAPDMSDAQNFYVTLHGIRWTGMPAWGKTLSETEIWQVVTFLANTGKLPPAAAKVLAKP